jgi:hypothetical protein
MHTQKRAEIEDADFVKDGHRVGAVTDLSAGQIMVLSTNEYDVYSVDVVRLIRDLNIRDVWSEFQKSHADLLRNFLIEAGYAEDVDFAEWCS